MIKKILGITLLYLLHTFVQAKPTTDTSLNGYWSLKDKGTPVFLMEKNNIHIVMSNGRKTGTTIPVTKRGKVFEGKFQGCLLIFSPKPQQQAEIVLKNCPDPKRNKVEKVYKTPKSKLPIDYEAMNCSTLEQHMAKAKQDNSEHLKKIDALSTKQNPDSKKKRKKMIMDLSRVMKIRRISFVMQNKNCSTSKTK